MINLKVDVDININEIAKQIEKNSEKAVFETAKVVLKDCNKYIKEDTGKLKESSKTASNLKEGKIAWDTPYARKQYYTGEPNKSKNANASKMWAHKAASIHSKEWKELMQKELRGE